MLVTCQSGQESKRSWKYPKVLPAFRSWTSRSSARVRSMKAVGCPEAGVRQPCMPAVRRLGQLRAPVWTMILRISSKGLRKTSRRCVALDNVQNPYLSEDLHHMSLAVLRTPFTAGKIESRDQPSRQDFVLAWQRTCARRLLVRLSLAADFPQPLDATALSSPITQYRQHGSRSHQGQ